MFKPQSNYGYILIRVGDNRTATERGAGGHSAAVGKNVAEFGKAFCAAAYYGVVFIF